MDRVLKPGKHCVLVLGDVERDGKSRRTAELIGDLAESVSHNRLRVQELVTDEIPDIRRSRRRTRTTKVEKVLVLKKADATVYRTVMPSIPGEVALVRDQPRPTKPTTRRDRARNKDAEAR
jgi:hypothetical protein